MHTQSWPKSSLFFFSTFSSHLNFFVRNPWKKALAFYLSYNHYSCLVKLGPQQQDLCPLAPQHPRPCNWKVWSPWWPHGIGSWWHNDIAILNTNLNYHPWLPMALTKPQKHHWLSDSVSNMDPRDASASKDELKLPQVVDEILHHIHELRLGEAFFILLIRVSPYALNR